MPKLGQASFSRQFPRVEFGTPLIFEARVRKPARPLDMLRDARASNQTKLSTSAFGLEANQEHAE